MKCFATHLYHHTNESWSGQPMQHLLSAQLWVLGVLVGQTFGKVVATWSLWWMLLMCSGFEVGCWAAAFGGCDAGFACIWYRCSTGASGAGTSGAGASGAGASGAGANGGCQWCWYFNCIIILKRFVFHSVAMHGWGNTWLVYRRFHLFIIKLRLPILYAPDMPVFFPFFEKMDNSRILANFTVVEWFQFEQGQRDNRFREGVSKAKAD